MKRKGTGVAETGKRSYAAIAVLVLSLGLAACGSSGQIEGSLENYTAEEIFQRGEGELAKDKPENAALYFSEIERLYPYSEWAKRGVIMAAFAYHQDGQYDNARGAAQRYLDFYPTGDDAAYAQYLLALSYYDQIDDIGRDQGLTFQALQGLRRVIEVYPDSEYAALAVPKFDLAFDHLAGKEMEIGRYYLRGGHYLAAANRFRVVVADFQTTQFTAEALYRLIEAYLALGLNEEAQAAGAILGYNYQSSDWYRDGYTLLTGQGLRPDVVGDNWLSQIYRQMLRGEWI